MDTVSYNTHPSSPYGEHSLLYYHEQFLTKHEHVLTLWPIETAVYNLYTPYQQIPRRQKAPLSHVCIPSLPVFYHCYT